MEGKSIYLARKIEEAAIRDEHNEAY